MSNDVTLLLHGWIGNIYQRKMPIHPPLLISSKKPAISSFLLVHAFEMNVKKDKGALVVASPQKKKFKEFAKSRTFFNVY